jgi:hypothetical protein
VSVVIWCKSEKIYKILKRWKEEKNMEKAIYLREGNKTELLQLMSKAKTEAEKVEIFRAYEPKEKRSK